MAPHPSRGCDACHARKIKCDEKQPNCAKCESSGIVCSGPLLGPVMVFFDPRIKAQKKQKRQKQKNVQRSLPAGDKNASSVSQIVLAVSNQSRNLQAKPSEGPVIQDWFTSKLQEIIYIPDQRHDSAVASMFRWSSSYNLPTLQHAVQAVSTAFNGNWNRSPDLHNRAQGAYTIALKGLRKSLSKDKEVATASQPSVSLEMVAVAVMFVWYEGLISTTATGWLEHAKGVGRLVLSKRPEDFKSGHGFSVFLTARYMMATQSLLMVEPNRLATSSWMTIPFSNSAKGSMDQLVDFMLLSTILLGWIDRSCLEALPIPQNSAADKILKNIHLLENMINNWWVNYESELIGNGHWVYKDIAPDWLDPDNGDYVPITREYFSEAVAECVIHYETCRLLISVMKAAYSGITDDCLAARRSEARAQTASILSVVPWFAARTTTYYAREFFGVAIILLLVIVACPNQPQRDYARLIIETWGPPDGLSKGGGDGPLQKWSVLRTIWARYGENESKDRSSAGPVQGLEIPIRQA